MHHMSVDIHFLNYAWFASSNTIYFTDARNVHRGRGRCRQLQTLTTYNIDPLDIDNLTHATRTSRYSIGHITRAFFAITEIERRITTMAAEKVFDTAELLEWVLLELDFKDILKAKAISRKCKATIEGSIKIKRKLFLVADGDPITLFRQLRE